MSRPSAVPPCEPKDVGVLLVGEGGEPTPEPLRSRLLEYFAQFDAPRRRPTPGGMMLGNLLCSCGAGLDGLMGSATWAIVHGEMFCAVCKRPGRAHHNVKEHETDAEPFLTVRHFPLLYRSADVGT